MFCKQTGKPLHTIDELIKNDAYNLVGKEDVMSKCWIITSLLVPRFVWRLHFAPQLQVNMNPIPQCKKASLFYNAQLTKMQMWCNVSNGAVKCVGINDTTNIPYYKFLLF